MDRSEPEVPPCHALPLPVPAPPGPGPWPSSLHPSHLAEHPSHGHLSNHPLCRELAPGPQLGFLDGSPSSASGGLCFLTVRLCDSRGASTGGASGREPACQCRRLKTQVRSLGGEDPLEEGRATPSSTLAWRIPVDRGAWRAAVPGVA